MRISVLIIMICMLALVSCRYPLDPLGIKTWVATDPIQCLGNPWEQAWLEEHGGDYASYPGDRMEQFEIIRDYYSDIGIRIFRITTRNTYSVVCCACSCAAGYTLYLLVSEDDVPAMIELGYRVSAPYTQ